MDFRVVWSPEAIEDVDSIATYISRDSKRYATAVVVNFLNVARDLTCSPHVGRVVPKIEDELIRERIVYSYRLIYRLRDETITIAAVFTAKDCWIHSLGALMNS